MIVCIPAASNSGPDARLADHFGEAPFFAVFDTASQSLVFTANKNPHKGHGACDPEDKIGDIEFDCILCTSMGKKAVAKFKTSGIIVYQAEADTIQELIPLMNDGRLTVLIPKTGCDDSSVDDSCNPADCAGGECGEGGCQPPQRFDV